MRDEGYYLSVKEKAADYAKRVVETEMVQRSGYYLNTCENHLYCVAVITLLCSKEDDPMVNEVDILENLMDTDHMSKAYHKAVMETGIWFSKNGCIHTDHPLYYPMKSIHDYLENGKLRSVIWEQTRCLRLCLTYETRQQMAG